MYLFQLVIRLLDLVRTMFFRKSFAVTHGVHYRYVKLLIKNLLYIFVDSDSLPNQ